MPYRRKNVVLFQGDSEEFHQYFAAGVCYRVYLLFREQEKVGLLLRLLLWSASYPFSHDRLGLGRFFSPPRGALTVELSILCHPHFIFFAAVILN